MSQTQPIGDFRVLVEPDTRTSGTYLAATSQAGSRAGAITPVQATSMALVSQGTADASLAVDADIATYRAGSPEPLGASFRWRPDGTTDYYSWDPPTTISGFEFVDRGAAGAWGGFHAVRLPSGLVLCSAIATSTGVSVWRQSTTATWTQVVVRTGASTPQACLCPLPSGRVLCFSTNSESTSTIQVRMHYSDDSGVTWNIGATDVLDVPAGHAASTVVRLRAAYLSGQIALFIQYLDTTDIIHQWAGDGAGSSMTKIATFSSADRAGLDCISHNGEILVAMVEKLAAGTYAAIHGPRLYRLGSAYQLLTTSTPVLACSATDTTVWGTYAGAAYTNAEGCLVADDDGTLYFFGRGLAAATYPVTASLSNDNGATWDATYQSRGSSLGLELYNSKSASTRMFDLAVCAERGRMVMFHRWVAAGTTADDSLCLAYLGGYSTVPMPEDASTALTKNTAGWDVVWVSINTPSDDAVFASSTVGTAPVNTLGSAGLNTTTIAGAKQKWTATPTIDSGKEGRGVLATVQLLVASGTGVFEVRASNATNSFWVRVSVTTTSIVLRDLVAVADLATITTTAGATGVEIRVALGQPTGTFSSNVGYVQAWYRSSAAVQSSNIYGPRTWTSIGSSTTLSKDASVTSLVSFENSTGASDITSRWCAYTSGTYIGPANCFDAATVRGRFYGPSVNGNHIWRGAQLSAISGPTVRGDTWDLATFYDYGVRNLDPFTSPSSRRPWRSTGVSVDQDITLTVDMGLVAGELIGIYLQGCNFKNAAIYQDSGATTKIADVSLLLGGSLAFDRTRNLITPAAGGTALTVPCQEHRLAGCYWVDSIGGTPRKILTNTSGDWRLAAVTTYRPTRLTLEAYAGGDLATGSAGQIWSDRVLIITQLTTSTNTITLRIPYLTNAGVASYFTVGTMAVGRVHILGPKEHAYRSWETMSGTERVEGRYGSTHSRRTIPARMAVELPFTDGATTAPEWNLTSDYYTLGYGSAPPISKFRADSPGRIEGLIRRVGQSVPIVYAPKVAQITSAPTSATPIQINDPQQILWAFIETETLRTDVVVGDEHSSELVRQGTVKLLEVS